MIVPIPVEIKKLIKVLVVTQDYDMLRDIYGILASNSSSSGRNPVG